MTKGIRLHPKFGVNPTVLACHICGKDYGVGLLGAACKDEAPHSMALPGELCGDCEKKYLTEGHGVMLIAATMEWPPRGNRKRPVPTGDIIVLKEEAFRRIFPCIPVPSHRRVFADPEVVKRLDKEGQNASE